MRTSIIPAQITTVEDKIAGNLNMTQIGILMVPVFLGTAIYCFFPPFMHFAIYKVVVVAFIVIVALLLALRIKGKVVLNWLVILLRFFTEGLAYVSSFFIAFKAFSLSKRRPSVICSTLNKDCCIILPLNT